MGTRLQGQHVRLFVVALLAACGLVLLGAAAALGMISVLPAALPSHRGAAAPAVKLPRAGEAVRDAARRGQAGLEAPLAAAMLGPAASDLPWTPLPGDAGPPGTSEFPLTAVAWHYKTDIFKAPARRPKAIGYARRGSRVAVSARPTRGAGCAGGDWFAAYGGGFVCTRRGFRVGKRAIAPKLHYVLPDQRMRLPYRYVEMIRQGAPRLYRLPQAAEVGQLARAEQGKEAWPRVVERSMRGVFFLAIGGPSTKHLGWNFLRTVYGRYVRARDVKRLPRSAMHGETLVKRHRLPLAFVYGADQPVYRFGARGRERVGTAEKHARFVVSEVFAKGGQRYVLDRAGRALEKGAVRIARRSPRPAKIGADTRWIHVDLSEQTLVAYRGDAPMFATIISSGKRGYEPPTGLFRIVRKHVTTTMNGSDPIDGWYEVEEVPWTLYYWEGYALHGAYWHDDFGEPRSHGCTNLAPADARWLFHWTTPKMPKGWHGVEGNGTWVQFTA